ncbi:hypothetical protein QA635_08070 [Bradyrhizobium brasilense]|uniref:hypothetical protein n=1 Tax=Bradyrhizobium brasilense TaxID=1419277 RepID=UPI0024B0DFD6|nr:hypothetical protein [Bradyrhizobium australafricanum]WFU34365.1 hypothetical protein QA635_08070 [Bradyrhizobium australafricanum]
MSISEHDAKQIVEVLCHAQRDLPDCVKPLQLLNFSFGYLPLLALSAQFPVGFRLFMSFCRML